MGKTVYFQNMFSDYEPPEELQKLLSGATIAAADINPISRQVRVAIHGELYIPGRLLSKASEDIATLYGLKNVEIIATHPAEELQKVEPEELMGLFVAQNSMTRGSLAGAKWTWEDNALHIGLKANGKAAIEECIPAVVRSLQERFAAPVKINVEAGSTLEG